MYLTSLNHFYIISKNSLFLILKLPLTFYIYLILFSIFKLFLAQGKLLTAKEKEEI